MTEIFSRRRRRRRRRRRLLNPSQGLLSPLAFHRSVAR